MPDTTFQLPPLSSLLAFEAAGRLSSFRQAADELDVTPSAVSHQIKALERDMNLSLFKREHRSVTLTSDGEALLRILQTSLKQVSSGIEQLRQGGKNRPVTICATTAMSSLWLTPRLSQFWKTHGDIAVNQHVSDTGPARGMPFDLQIWYGQSPPHSDQASLLFQDRLLPVCSVAFAATLTSRSLASLASQPLIHLDNVSEWTSWVSWFQGLGFDGELQAGMRVNNYTIAVQAARDDVGLLLGWEHLLAPIIERGLLVTLEEHVLDAPGSFYLASCGDTEMREPVRILYDWLLESV